MERHVFCVKLHQELEGLTSPPFPGLLGDIIFNQVSQQAWLMWLSHQTMLINEYRLSLIAPAARTFLQAEMNKYFFGEGSAAPSGFTPISKAQSQ